MVKHCVLVRLNEVAAPQTQFLSWITAEIMCATANIVWSLKRAIVVSHSTYLYILYGGLAVNVNTFTMLLHFVMLSFSLSNCKSQMKISLFTAGLSY